MAPDERLCRGKESTRKEGRMAFAKLRHGFRRATFSPPVGPLCLRSNNEPERTERCASGRRYLTDQTFGKLG